MEPSETDAAVVASAAARPSSARRAIGIATAATFVAYAVTLAQQVLFARALGVGPATDAFAAALAWGVATSGPVGTTLGSVLLPRYVAARVAGDTGESRHLFGTGSAIGLVIGVGLSALTFVAAVPLAAILAPGLDGPNAERLATLLRITAPMQLLWVLVWLAVTRANARERYLLAAGSFAVPPIPVIAVLTTIRGVTVEQVAVAYLFGALAQVLVVVAADRRDVAELIPRVSVSAIRAIAPGLIGVGAAMALMSSTGLILRALASLHGVGAVATSDYANRLEVAGEQVLLSGLLAVVFTRWSATLAGRGSGLERHRGGLSDGIVQLVGAALVLAAAVPLLSAPVVGLLLEGGRFGRADTQAVAAFLAWMSLGIGARVVILVAMRALLAASRYRDLFTAAFAVLVVLTAAGLIAGAALGLNGVALAYSLGWAAAAVVAVVALQPNSVAIGRELVRAALAAGAAFVVTAAVVAVAPAAPAVHVLLGGATFVLAAWLVGHLLGVAVVRELESQLSARWAHP